MWCSPRYDQFINGLLPYLATLDLRRPTVVVTAPLTPSSVRRGRANNLRAGHHRPRLRRQRPRHPAHRYFDGRVGRRAFVYPTTGAGAADAGYDISYAAGELTIEPAPTALETNLLSLAQSIVSRSTPASTRLSTSTVTGAPLQGMSVRFNVSQDVLRPAMTDSNGVARGGISWAMHSFCSCSASHSSATYAGTCNYEPSTATAPARLP